MDKKFNQNGYTRAKNSSEVPQEPHFAVIKFGSVWIEGDERSRTNPGHGYPGHSQSTVEYLIFKDQSSWEKYIGGLLHPNYGTPDKNWVAIQAKPATIQTSVTVKVLTEPYCDEHGRIRS